MVSALEPTDLAVAWTPDGVFARRRDPHADPDVAAVFWFLVAFWSAVAAIPIGMAVGVPNVTLACLIVAGAAAWLARTLAPRAIEIRGNVLTLRGFDRVRVPLDRVTSVRVGGSVLTVHVDDGRQPWLWVQDWSPAARRWLAHLIEDAVAKARATRPADVATEAAARRSLARLRHEVSLTNGSRDPR